MNPNQLAFSIAGVQVPQVIFGTSALGNLFTALDDTVKLQIVEACVRSSDGPVFFDSAGKYGAGLALESLGKCLRQLGVKPENVVICNKLGWVRTELKTAEPTFEPGVWKGLKHDAVQRISYEGILECFEQGNELLDGYNPQMVSIHDPDEYLAKAQNDAEAQALYNDILDAYAALFHLKKEGKVQAVGVGAKDWKTVQRIAGDVALDWVMIANSLTIKSHPPELLAFVQELQQKGVMVINSAVFHSGFLVGGSHFDYKPVVAGTPEGDALLQWRKDFQEVCAAYQVNPATACIQFGLNAPGVNSIALSTTHASRVAENIAMVHANIPAAFWETLEARGLITINLMHKAATTS